MVPAEAYRHDWTPCTIVKYTPEAMSASLHTQRVTEPGSDPERWLYLLHGIFGAGRNWNAVARRIVSARPEWGVLAVDLRGHGRSAAGEPPHTVEACARDLDALVSGGAPAASAVLGHSFGGKVAALFAAHAELESLWIADSTPGVREAGGSAWRMLEVLETHPGPFLGREAAIAAVEMEGYANPVAQWMATNVERGADGAWRWRLDAGQMRALLVDFFERDAWPEVRAAAERGTRVRLLRGTESSVVSPIDLERWAGLEAEGLPIRRHDLASGHWLNADAPDRVAEIVAADL